MDNYQISRDRAQVYFLGFDQEKLIRTWDLKHDAQRLYVDFFGRSYAIHRQTGVVTRLFDGLQAGFEEVLTIFDLLCHGGECKALSRVFAPVNSLKGASAAGVDTNFYGEAAARFDRAPEEFAAACRKLGGQGVAMGDMGFRFSVFAGLDVILKFYHGDEEFPASLILLWDENTLQFMFYETTFYAAGFLLHAIEELM